MPKREIQVERKASAHEDEEMEERGVASSQRVVLSIIVRMCEHPWEVGRGPTMSTWTWEKRLSGIGMGRGGGEKHGGGFLLFGKECILLSTDLYQWPCGTKQNGKK